MFFPGFEILKKGFVSNLAKTVYFKMGNDTSLPSCSNSLCLKWTRWKAFQKFEEIGTTIVFERTTIKEILYLKEQEGGNMDINCIWKKKKGTRENKRL